MIRKVLSIILALFVSVESTNVVDFQCKFEQVGWHFVPDVKNCYGRKVDIRVKNVEIETINGDNSTKDSVVEGLWIENEIVQYFPKGIANFFPNLKAFGIQKSELKEITKFDLAPFPDLVRFMSVHNQLEFVESDLFMYNSKIKSVSLVDNKLFIIGHDVFLPTNQLIELQFEVACLNRKCENGGRCLENLKSDLKKNCPSDTAVGDFRREIQRLENELNLSKRREVALLKDPASCYPDIDIRVMSKK